MSVFGNKETIPVEAVRIRRSVSKATIKPQKSAYRRPDGGGTDSIGLNSQYQVRLGQAA